MQAAAPSSILRVVLAGHAKRARVAQGGNLGGAQAQHFAKDFLGVLAPCPFAEQCRIAAALRYAGLEIAPFTLSDDPAAMSDAQAREIARIAVDHGIAMTDLHWLPVKPEGLSITWPDATVHARTVAFMQRLCELTAAMGGKCLVHGSPKRSTIPDGETKETARATAAFAAAGEAARSNNVTYASSRCRATKRRR